MGWQGRGNLTQHLLKKLMMDLVLAVEEDKGGVSAGFKGQLCTPEPMVGKSRGRKIR